MEIFQLPIRTAPECFFSVQTVRCLLRFVLALPPDSEDSRFSPGLVATPDSILSLFSFVREPKGAASNKRDHSGTEHIGTGKGFDQDRP